MLAPAEIGLRCDQVVLQRLHPPQSLAQDRIEAQLEQILSTDFMAFGTRRGAIGLAQATVEAVGVGVGEKDIDAHLPAPRWGIVAPSVTGRIDQGQARDPVLPS